KPQVLSISDVEFYGSANCRLAGLDGARNVPQPWTRRISERLAKRSADGLEHDGRIVPSTPHSATWQNFQS
ncbi:MAG: hypothetical protein ABL908_10630, partial [Hyphomicrobium sp.]